jgi:hypothetical protein
VELEPDTPLTASRCRLPLGFRRFQQRVLYLRRSGGEFVGLMNLVRSKLFGSDPRAREELLRPVAHRRSSPGHCDAGRKREPRASG